MEQVDGGVGCAFGRRRRYRARTRRTSYTCSFRGTVHCAQVGSMEPPGCWGDAGVPLVRHHKLLGEMWSLMGTSPNFCSFGPAQTPQNGFSGMFRHVSSCFSLAFMIVLGPLPMPPMHMQACERLLSNHLLWSPDTRKSHIEVHITCRQFLNHTVHGRKHEADDFARLCGPNCVAVTMSGMVHRCD